MPPEISPTAENSSRPARFFQIYAWKLVRGFAQQQLETTSETPARLQRIKNELAQNKATCTLAYWHHPVYSSGGHGDNPKMQDAWQILFAANVGLISHGHDDERFDWGASLCH